MEYALIVCDTETELCSRVDKGIRAGWVPQGGVSVAVRNTIHGQTTTCIWVQAMIRKFA